MEITNLKIYRKINGLQINNQKVINEYRKLLENEGFYGDVKILLLGLIGEDAEKIIIFS